MKLKHFLFFSLLTIFLSSCVDYKDVEIVGIKDIKVEKIDQSGVKATISLQVKNPNNYKISVVGSDLDLYVNGNKLGKAELKDKIKLKKNSNDVHVFRVESNFKDAGMALLPSLLTAITKGSVQLKIKGTIKGKAFLVCKKIPVEFSENVRL